MCLPPGSVYEVVEGAAQVPIQKEKRDDILNLLPASNQSSFPSLPFSPPVASPSPLFPI